MSGSDAVALVSALIAFTAPKMALYGGRLYMEMPLAALMLVALTFLHRYLRLRERRDLVLAAVFVGLACATKQQALFLLVAAGAFLYAEAAWHVARRHAPLLRAIWAPAAFTAITAAITLPALLWLLHSNGRIFPDTEFTQQANAIGASVAGYQAPEQPWSAARWDGFLNSVYGNSDEAAIGTQKAEARHIWPADVLSPNGFLAIHSPYIQDLEPKVSIGVILQVLLIAGLVLWLKTPRSRAFTVFFGGWLLLNYLSFVRENDQQRYYLFIAFACLFAIPLCVERLARCGGWRVAMAAVLALAVPVTVYASSDLPNQASVIQSYMSRQAYEPSSGGLRSVEYASDYLEHHLPADATYYAVPQTEFQYYAKRDGIFDYRIYFLSQELIANYLVDQKVEYVVLPESAIKQDSEWNHVVSVPRSFALKIAAMYPLAYETPKKDVYVFRVLPLDQTTFSRAIDLDAPRDVRIERRRPVTISRATSMSSRRPPITKASPA